MFVCNVCGSFKYNHGAMCPGSGDYGGDPRMNVPTLFDGLDVPPIHSTTGGDNPRVRKSSPDTSHAAADGNDVRGSRAAVLAAFYDRNFMADHELVDHLAGTPYTPSRIRTARHELACDGVLEFAGYKTPTRTGALARVWTLRKEAA